VRSDLLFRLATESRPCYNARMHECSRGLPEELRPLLWDYDFDQMTWEADRDLVTARVLTDGLWSAVTWLRTRLSDDDLRRWIQIRHGRGLSPQQLRFWELILDLPHRRVSSWLARPERRTWDQRVRR
jgi:hypothetical protein